jgi:hypothetical protein
MATGIANFPNRPYKLRIEVWFNWQSGRSASVHVEVWIDGCHGSWSNSGSSFEVYVDGVGRVAAWSGGFDFRNKCNILIHASDHNVWTPVNGDIGAQAYANYNVLGYTQVGAVHDGAAASPPPAPRLVEFRNITTTGMTAQFVNQGDGGSPITGWQYQLWTDPSFNGAGVASAPGDGIIVRNDLTPGTNFYWRFRGLNEAGTGAWSPTYTQATLPAVAPGMVLAPSLSGAAMQVQLSPPGGTSGVTKYTVEYRIGTGTATVVEKANGPIDVAGLTPGTVYQWRASAWIGTYQSPWTAWTPLQQPNPNTNPGDYFDGATAARADLTFGWVSTAHGSVSEARGVLATGWEATVSGALTTTAPYRVTGGDFGSYSARVDILTASTAAGQLIAGQSAASLSYRSEVEEGSVYVGSIHVAISRSQRGAAQLRFYNGAGVAVGSAVVGTAQVVPALEFTRLSVSAPVPAGAETAVVTFTDVAGAGWSVWLSGEYILLDGAMISLGTLFPYFDGSFANDLVNGWDYVFLGADHASPSRRDVIPVSEIDPLADPDCPAPPKPPALPTITTDCIEEVGTWRQYAFAINAGDVPLWTSTLPTLILKTSAAQERQVRIRYFANPNGLAPEEVVGNGFWEAEQILTYLPANTELTLDGVGRKATASVAGGEVLPANQLLYGTGGAPATWPELRCGVGYVVSLDVPLDAPAGNLSSRVVLTQRM